MNRRRYCYTTLFDIWERTSSDDIPVQESHTEVRVDPNAKMIISDTGIRYYTSLPEGSERCKVYTQFYKLKTNRKSWTKENLVLRVGMYYLIYSPVPDKYFLRQVYDEFDPERLKKYIVDRNLFLINK